MYIHIRDGNDENIKVTFEDLDKRLTWIGRYLNRRNVKKMTKEERFVYDKGVRFYPVYERYTIKYRVITENASVMYDISEDEISTYLTDFFDNFITVPTGFTNKCHLYALLQRYHGAYKTLEKEYAEQRKHNAFTKTVSTYFKDN